MSNPAAATRASWQQPHRRRHAFAAPIPERAHSSPVPSLGRHPCKLSVETRCIAACRAPHPTRRRMSNPWSHHPPSPSPVHSVDARRGSTVACSSASTQAATHLPHHLQLRICTWSVRVWSFRGWHGILPPLLARRAPLRRLSSSAPGKRLPLPLKAALSLIRPLSSVSLDLNRALIPKRYICHRGSCCCLRSQKS